MSYSEVQFILTEAAEKGYISGGSTADELRINEANYAKGVSLVGGADDLKTHVWWDKQ